VRQRTYRQRQARGEFYALVPVDAAILDFLQKSRWLNEADMSDRKRVGAAIRDLLETSSRV
jgi:hypothetical protein